MSGMSEQPPDPYGTPNPYGQSGPSYGGQSYGAPGYGGQGPYVAQDHPQATTVLILGILGLVLCQILGPVAWVMGNRVVREIDASGGAVGGRSSANAGRICGIISTALIVLGFLAGLLIVIIAIAAGTSTSTS
jgi:uncharacterized membrane protein YjgN (DUF898 family)